MSEREREKGNVATVAMGDDEVLQPLSALAQSADLIGQLVNGLYAGLVRVAARPFEDVEDNVVFQPAKIRRDLLAQN